MKKRTSIKTITDLKEYNLVDQDNEKYILKVTKNFATSITPNMIDKLNKSGVYKQFVPNKNELDIRDNELVDPIGDNKNEKVKGVVHRYPDRCLLKVVSVCPVYCRFCFRKELIGPKQKSLTKEELQKCFQYIESKKEIWEVILTGGDPLILKPNYLNNILESLNKIDHVEVLRIHTRVPIVSPERITDELILILKKFVPVYIVIHANHPDEFDEDNIKAINKLVENGIVLLSQSVLLKGINDNIETLSTLMKCFIKNRIKPYYLHHLDYAKGTNHFRTKIDDGQKLIEQLRGRFSGICQPTYVIDIPGGYGKSPLTPSYIVKEKNKYIIKDYNENHHNYSD